MNFEIKGAQWLSSKRDEKTTSSIIVKFYYLENKEDSTNFQREKIGCIQVISNQKGFEL